MKRSALHTFIICIVILLQGFSVKTFAQTPPRAYDVGIQGNHQVGSFMSGIYSYSDTNNRPEGISRYRWLRADSITQPNPVAIDTATKISYKTTSLDTLKFIAFEVTPVAVGTGDSLIGTPVRAWSLRIINEVGISEMNMQAIRFYPNPATTEIFILNSEKIEKTELYSYDGRDVTSMITFSVNRMDISMIPGGIYFVKVQFSNHTAGISRLVKL